MYSPIYSSSLIVFDKKIDIADELKKSKPFYPVKGVYFKSVPRRA
jgi:hypothetical protein